MFKKIYKKLIVILGIIIVLVIVDILLVIKMNVGPFLAVRVKKYNDGGSKVYYGLGYKVIKYHQKQGRRDTVIGTWNLKYSAIPIDRDIVDLAIEFTDNKDESFKKYNGLFMRISGKLYKIDKKNKVIYLKFNDSDGGKYSFIVKCNLVSDSDISKLKKNSIVYVIGSVSSYKSDTLVLNNCFAE